MGLAARNTGRTLQTALEKARAGERLTWEDGLALYNQAKSVELGQLAQRARFRVVPASRVSYLIDRNINYTNVCSTDCSFCGFYRPESNHPESYVLSREELGSKIQEAVDYGATRILLQGGHNEELPYSFYVDMVKWIHENFAIEINAFSPSEVHQMHLVSGYSYQEILSDLQEAGLRGLPGGGAEILDDVVRKRISPKKIRSKIWLDIMGHAHRLGLTTSATMVIGFGEGLPERMNHLQALRDLQDKALERGDEGFNAFISWTLQHNENTSLGRSRHREKYGSDSLEYLRNVAVARLFLDNITHHSASWPTLGVEIGKNALHFGCDDFGSTMMEENVVSQAGALTQSKWCMSPEELRECIVDAGFQPVQRNSSYEYL